MGIYYSVVLIAEGIDDNAHECVAKINYSLRERNQGQFRSILDDDLKIWFMGRKNLDQPLIENLVIGQQWEHPGQVRLFVRLDTIDEFKLVVGQLDDVGNPGLAFDGQDWYQPKAINLSEVEQKRELDNSTRLLSDRVGFIELALQSIPASEETKKELSEWCEGRRAYLQALDVAKRELSRYRLL